MAIEFDVQMTMDEQLVIMHDETVDRTTDGSGCVSQLSLANLKALDAGGWFRYAFGYSTQGFGSQFAGQRVPTFDEALEVVRSHAQVSPSIALDVKKLSPAIINLICDSIQKHRLIEDVIGIGAIIRTIDVRRQFCEVLSDFQCAAVAETRDDLDTALSDIYSKWVYARFVPTAEDVHFVHRRLRLTVQLVNQAGKRLFVSGDEVSQDVNRAHDAYRAGPDMLLTWHPSRLAELVGA